ncbi:hypothetical protein TeGR_g7920, partial [Tetraparma gracilis]
ATSGVYYNILDAPVYLRPLFSAGGLRVLLREWEDAAFRALSGWSGTDLIHNPVGEGVVVNAYFWDPSSKVLTGIATFGPAAESHRGLCHGGAMTSLMDDVCGHLPFLHGGEKPWDGATVQVDCQLLKPVPVGSVLCVRGRVTKVEKKKVFLEAELIGDSLDEPVIYAKMKGLTLRPVRMGQDDAVGRRKWMPGREVMLDSGWLLP